MEWNIFHDEVSYWTSSGYVGSPNITVTQPTYVEQKNVGKANETSIEQQVLNEVAAKIQYQIDQGYSREIPGEEKRFEVSLADKYPDRQEKGKLDFPYIVESKIDGVRSFIKIVDGDIRMFSRKHKEFVSCPHIKENLFVKKFFELYPDAILDGELYNHTLNEDFNKIVSLVKKTKPKLEDLAESAKLVQYHCFDSYYPSEPGLDYINRKVRVASVLTTIVSAEQLSNAGVLSYNDVTLVGITCSFEPDTNKTGWLMTRANTEEEVENILDKCIADGYEGVMLKKNVPYFFGRSFDMLKYKRFVDDEFKIIDIEDGKGNKAGKATAVICVDDTGNEFKAGIIGNEEYAAKLFNNKDEYIGKIATIKYQELTPVKDGTGGVPRFGKMVSIRDYE